MEDDDEFGDLYTDVLTPFSSSSVNPPPIDLNSPPNSEGENRGRIEKDDENSGVFRIPGLDSRVLQDTHLNLDMEKDLEQKGVRNSDLGDNQGGEFGDRDANFGIEEEINGGVGVGVGVSEPIIPGLGTCSSIQEGSGTGKGNGNLSRKDDLNSEADDWDSDSEDDLQIVLNDSNHGPMAMDMNGMAGSDDEDENGEPLVIVADDDAGHDQVMNEQEWGEEAGQGADGERKEMVEGAKANGALTAAPKIGYSNYGYHPFHSQFKYVRPGAAPMPGGAPGQVRPPLNMGTIGRGRGDWRPTGVKGPLMQKGFHPGFWGSNGPGRGFGGGLDFTLPSHKTIFEVDIDSFEEKPWKHPGVDISDYFNFGLNEETWKEYCKQLELLRLESTMQSKIRVYESGRAEQDYDPDLPPELAAAAGILDPSAENSNVIKADGGLSDQAKGYTRVRPPLPTGRAIQVETGQGERLPSIDTRPPRIRDPDTIIEIVLQDSLEEDSSAGNGVAERPDNDSYRDDHRLDVVEEDGAQGSDEYFDGYRQKYSGVDKNVGKSSPHADSPYDDMPEEERPSPSPARGSAEYHHGSRSHASDQPSEDVDNQSGGRQTKGKARETSPHKSPDDSAGERGSREHWKEESIESVEGQHGKSSSPPVGVERERSSGEQIVPDDDDPVHRLSEKEMDGDDLNTSKDKHKPHSTRHQRLSYRTEPEARKDVDDSGDLKASRSSENSKASGSSRDHPKWRDSIDEEVIQGGHSAYMGVSKRHRGEDGHGLRRKDRDGRIEMERNYVSTKGREDPYGYRDWDPYGGHHFHGKPESMDRRKERNYSDGTWELRDEDSHGRRARAEDSRRHERADEMISRHRGKIRESGKDEHLPLRRPDDSGSWREYQDKDVGLRYREKDDNLKVRYENSEDHRSKRRKEGERLRRDYIDKEDMLYDQREGSIHHKRERDEIPDPRKRDDQLKVRESIADQHSLRHKDESWSHRDRAERQRERDEWHRSRQTYEENLSGRDNDTRGSTKSSRALEEKTGAGHSRVKGDYRGHDKDYQYKDAGRHGEQHKRKDRVDDGSQQRRVEDAYTHGNQFYYEEKRSKQEKSSARHDRVHASDGQRVHEKKNKENSRKAKESEFIHQSTSGAHRKRQRERSGTKEVGGVRGTSKQDEPHISGHHQPIKEQKEDATSDEEQQDSKRGRSKLERWTSHKERDYNINARSSSSSKVKETCKDNASGSGFSIDIQNEAAEKVEAADNNQSMAGGKEGASSDVKDTDAKPTDDRHLDMVARLKRRSERFKLPMPSDKDALVIKKMESEPLPCATAETPPNPEVKPERPARKRRWISN